jgi:hypothetical protein
LDLLVQNFDAKVFAIEYNYSSELRFLEDYYTIKRTPAVIVNFGMAREGFASYDQLAALVREEN